jgi:thiol-disulfide isomerase/thioredoxin
VFAIQNDAPMNKLLVGFLAITSIIGCKPNQPADATLKTGIWRGVIETQGHPVPFTFEVSDSANHTIITLRNAEERIRIDEVVIDGDSINIPMHIYDANIKAKLIGDSLVGEYQRNLDREYRLPFNATFGKSYRFLEDKNYKNTVSYDGKYAVEFKRDETITPAIGIFKQTNDQVTGTFLTATGDYRFLEGSIVRDTLYLSAFDGNAVYHFRATQSPDGTLQGFFYSGKSGSRTWTAHIDENAKLADSNTLTYLKDGYTKIDFTFPDVNGNLHSLQDEKYKNKVVILQILGTWCPNCLDETNFLVPWYTKNQSRGIEIIGLAYEQKDDFAYASSRVKKLVDKLSIPYEILIAGTPTKAAESLPMLNTVMAYPTTIFIGKDGNVKKIHTGFEGPGTGELYTRLIQEFNNTIYALVQE